MSFWDEALPYAQQAHSQTGVLTSVILAQWANETAYGGPDWSVFHNPGNVGDPVAGGQMVYPTLQAGVDAYISTMLLSYYDAVRAATTWQAQASALGRSPWAASHYGSPPGEDLVQIIIANDLTQYDGPTPPAPLPPLPLPILEETMSLEMLPNGTAVISAVGAGSRANHLLVFTLTPTNPASPGYNVIDVTDGIGTANPYTVTSA